MYENEFLHITEDSRPNAPPGYQQSTTARSRFVGGGSKRTDGQPSPQQQQASKKRRIANAVNEGALANTKPKFLKLFESCRVKETNVLLLTCQVTGDPAPKVHWHKDGRELKNNTRVNISHSPNGASTLYISRALLDDAGIYQVVASNVHGVSVYYAEIYVERTLFTLFIYGKIK
jgi:hypothetical protein